LPFLILKLEPNMASYDDLLISTGDAESLASVVGDGRRSHGVETDAADALAEVLMEARMVAGGSLPADRVAMNSKVDYREEPGGERRTVAVVPPGEAKPSEGRISVLSPVGRALLGRRIGSVASISVPGGRALTIRVLGVERAPLLEEA
jgi:regulator of nucleoside diphosphate kinase